MTLPQISVIMPVYNAGKYLKESIDSILNQSFYDFEFFIIDDKSVDNSLEIIKSYKDDRIILIEKEVNTGYTDSLNMAIKLSKGKYIARMDADDISVKDRFLKQHSYMEDNPDILLLGSSYKIIGKEKIYNFPKSYEDIKVFALTQNPIPHPTVLIRSSILHDNELFYDRSYEPAEDFELWTRIIELGRVENLQEVLLNYRVHEGQISNTKKEIQDRAADKIRIKQLKKIICIDEMPFSEEFILGMLTKREKRISGESLVKLKKILNKIFEENKKKNLYDSVILERFLRIFWLHYVYSIYDYKLSSISAIFPANSINNMDLEFKIKFIVKSILKYK